MDPVQSFDGRGFRFAIRFFMLLGVVFAGVHFGTSFAAERIAETQAEQLMQHETMLAAARAEESVVNTPPILEKLDEYQASLSTRTIGTASIDTIAEAHELLIAADLSAMQLYVLENGVATATFPILSKGKRGSRWETPTGLYKIETKEENHFSSIGEVNMPFSMQFFGNFFIHGWPYYANGTPVPEGFSGGCIRLSTEDAQKVFAFARRGTPIFVWEGVAPTEGASTHSLSLSDIPLPRVSAKAFLVADIQTGTVYAEKNADSVFPIASISKLLTALVANETIHFDRTLTVTKDDRAQTEGTPGSIRAGETFTVGELLFPLLMESNNAAAYTLARYNGEETFVKWLNDKARAIGMTQTHMEDPSGLSPNNKASANDLFQLLRYINTSQSFILNLTREKEKTLKAENGRSYTFANFNHFAGTPGFIGGKTGYTPEARQTYASVWEISIAGEPHTIGIVLLQSDDRKTDVDALRNWFARAITP